MNVKLQTGLALVCSLALFTQALAQCIPRESATVEPVCEDEVWLVSAREVSACNETNPLQSLRVLRYCCGEWIESSLVNLTSTNDLKPSVVFVHGYQTNLQDAQLRGTQTYENLFIKTRESGPVRFIIWAWKSERETVRPAIDFEMKSKRALMLGDAFASTINMLGHRSPAIIGYSLGAQVVVSAFAQSSCYQGNPVSVAVIAAVNDCGFASCCSQLINGGNIEQCTVFFNNGDRAVRASNLVCRLRHGNSFQPFQDFAIQNTCSLGAVDIVDISDVSSRKHSIVRYTSLPIVQYSIQQMVRNR